MILLINLTDNSHLQIFTTLVLLLWLSDFFFFFFLKLFIIIFLTFYLFYLVGWGPAPRGGGGVIREYHLYWAMPKEYACLINSFLDPCNAGWLRREAWWTNLDSLRKAIRHEPAEEAEMKPTPGWKTGNQGKQQ